jgi:hypothetical protein
VAKWNATVPHKNLLPTTLEETEEAVKPEIDEIFSYNRDLSCLSENLLDIK